MTNTNMSPVMQWAENAVSLEQDFLAVAVEAIKQWSQGNRTDLSILLCVTHGIKTDLVRVIEKERMAYATPLKKILSIVHPGLSFKQDKNKSSGVTYVMALDAEDDPEAVRAAESALYQLVEMAQFGQTMRSAGFKEWVKTYSAPKVVSLKGYSESRTKAEKDAPRVLKTAYDAGHDKLAYAMELQKQLTSLIAGMQAARSAASDDALAIAAE